MFFFRLSNPNDLNNSNKPLSQASNNQIITVLINGEGITPSNGLNFTSQLTVASSAPTNNVPTQINCSKTPVPNHLDKSVSVNYTIGLSTGTYHSQNNFTVPYVQNDSNKPQSFTSTGSSDVPFTSVKINLENDMNKFIATAGGMFVPESVSNTETSLNKDGVRNRPTLLFPVDKEPKVLVGNELLTPGKALQQSNSLTTPQGRNLATLSPDTIDYVLNDDFQNSSQLDVVQGNPKNSTCNSRPASYPSLTSADLEFTVFNDPYQVNEQLPDSSPYRSNSFTHGSVQKKAIFESRDRATSCNVMVNSQTVPFTREDSLLDKKLNTASSFEFSPASFLKSLDEQISYTTTSSTQSDQSNGGMFVPMVDTSVLTQPRACSVSLVKRITGHNHCMQFLLV